MSGLIILLHGVAFMEETASARSNLGLLMKKRGEHAGAEAEYEAALRLDPESVEAHCNLGIILKKRGDMAGAEAAYCAAIAADELLEVVGRSHEKLATAFAYVLLFEAILPLHHPCNLTPLGATQANRSSCVFAEVVPGDVVTLSELALFVHHNELLPHIYGFLYILFPTPGARQTSGSPKASPRRRA